MTGVTKELCEFVVGTSLNDVPEPVIERSKYLLLDAVGCALVGAHLPWSRIAVEALSELEPSGAASASLWGWGGRRLSPATAALLNSAFVQAFELDDYHDRGFLHSGAVLLPATLALSEHLGDVPGARLLEAIVLGQEVGPRVGLAMGGAELIRRGWHGGAIYSPMAGVSACAKVKNLTSEQLEDAFGLAATQACGLMAAQFESMVKRMHHGLAARNAVMSTTLAAHGYTGIKSVIERDYGGYARTFGSPEHVQLDKLLDGLGEHWELLGTCVKPYACMSGMHAPIDAVLQLRDNGRLPGVDDIESITVTVGEWLAHKAFKMPRDVSPVSAQMNLQYAVAVAVLDGSALMDQYTPERLACEDVWNLLPRIKVVPDPSIDELGPGRQFKATVEITSPTGTEESTVLAPRGSSGRPLTNEEIQSKYETLMPSVITTPRMIQIAQYLLSLEQQESVEELVGLLAAESRRIF